MRQIASSGLLGEMNRAEVDKVNPAGGSRVGGAGASGGGRVLSALQWEGSSSGSRAGSRRGGGGAEDEGLGAGMEMTSPDRNPTKASWFSSRSAKLKRIRRRASFKAFLSVVSGDVM